MLTLNRLLHRSIGGPNETLVNRVLKDGASEAVKLAHGAGQLPLEGRILGRVVYRNNLAAQIAQFGPDSLDRCEQPGDEFRMSEKGHNDIDRAVSRAFGGHTPFR